MKFRSKFEANIYPTLPKGTEFEGDTLIYDKRTTRKMICQDCSSVRVLQKAKYLTDFKMPNGIYLEAKGYFPSQDRSKMESVIKCNPDCDIRMVFQKDGWVDNKKKHLKYSEWCTRRNIKWCVGKVPEGWMNE
jgi:hypothetical protein